MKNAFLTETRQRQQNTISLEDIIAQIEKKLQTSFDELNDLVRLDGEWDTPHCKKVCEATRKVLYRYINLLNAYELFQLRTSQEWMERLTERITRNQIMALFDRALEKIIDDPYCKNIKERKEDIICYDVKDYKVVDKVA